MTIKMILSISIAVIVLGSVVGFILNSNDELPENNCSICLEEFKNEDILKKLNCTHIFHKDCLGIWINNNNKTCPLCRRVVEV